MALGHSGWPGGSAQTPNSQKFVQLLLMNELTDIQADQKALNTLNNDILKLDSATSARKIKQLNKTLTKLNHEIVDMTTRLQVTSIQALNTARGLTPSNPALVSAAVLGLQNVESLVSQAGIPAATASQ